MVVEILDPIPPGLDKEVFFKRLQSDIETATARLIDEGRKGDCRKRLNLVRAFELGGELMQARIAHTQRLQVR